jgi:hypothetical protein
VIHDGEVADEMAAGKRGHSGGRGALVESNRLLRNVSRAEGTLVRRGADTTSGRVRAKRELHKYNV